MSEIIECKEDIIETSIIDVEEIKSVIVRDEETKSEETKSEEHKSEEKIEEKKEVMKTFVQLFEFFLAQEQEKLVKFNVKLSPEIQQYFLLLCKESPELFGSFEETFKRIISDNKINSKDIPDILVLVSKVHTIIKTNKGVPTLAPYELIKSLLHVTVYVYFENNKIDDSLTKLDILNIIDSAIDLIQITPIVSRNVGCGLFRC